MLFAFILIFIVVAILLGMFLVNRLYPDWRSKIPKPFKEVIIKNQTIQTTEVTEVYPGHWGAGKSFAVLFITICIVAVILIAFWMLSKRGNIFFKHNLMKCREKMYKKLINTEGTNIKFQDGIGTKGIPFSFFFKEDLRTQWAGCVFSLIRLGPNQPFNKKFSILTICSMNDPDNKFFPFPGWDLNDLISNFHIVGPQQPWARLDAVKLDVTMPFQLPEFQEGIRQGIQQKGKEAVVG